MLNNIKYVLRDAIFAEANLITVGKTALLFVCGLLIIYICERIRKSKKGLSHEKITIVNVCLLWAYICGLLYITLFNRETGVRCDVRWDINFGNLFGSPLEKKEFWYSFFNVILFVPAGIFITGLVNAKKNWLRYIISVIICFSCTVIIESLQFISRKGYFELSDIVCNCIGAMIGAFIGLLVFRNNK